MDSYDMVEIALITKRKRPVRAVSEVAERVVNNLLLERGFTQAPSL